MRKLGRSTKADAEALDDDDRRCVSHLISLSLFVYSLVCVLLSCAADEMFGAESPTVSDSGSDAIKKEEGSKKRKLSSSKKSKKSKKKHARRSGHDDDEQDKVRPCVYGS